jgi:hypothetical protein
VGQDAGAAVVLGVASATAEAGGFDAVGDADAEDEPPQAAMPASMTTEASTSRSELSIRVFTAAMLLAAERVVRFPMK